jgi:hypothetical protein
MKQSTDYLQIVNVGTVTAPSPVRLSDRSADLRGDHRNNHAGVRLFDAMPDLKNQLEFAKLRAAAGNGRWYPFRNCNCVLVDS